MGIGPNYQLIAGDWGQLELIINDLTQRFITQALTPTSSPTFAGLTLTGLTGVLKATLGVISGSSTFDNLGNGISVTMRTNLNADLLDGQHGTYYASAAGYVPYTGATTDLNLGVHNFTNSGNVSTGIVKTDNYQNAAGTESFVWIPTDSWWELSDDLYITGFLSLTQGILSVGTTTGFTIPSGAGTRLMWIPSIPAFRVGSVTGTEWDAANIGANSICMGLNCKASEEASIALGQTCQAIERRAVAIGDSCSAEGENSFAQGISCTASASTSFARGNTCVCSGEGGFVSGYLCNVTGDFGVALGSNCASGANGLSVGDTCTANGGSLAIGTDCVASGGNSIALGQGVGATSTGSVSIGNNSDATFACSGEGALLLGTVSTGESHVNSGLSSVAIGHTLNNSGSYAIVFGRDFTNTIASKFCVGFGELDFAVRPAIFDFAGPANTDLTFNFSGTTTSGIMYWMEDEDYFQFADDILLSTTERLQFRDIAIYVYSNTDGWLNLVADIGVEVNAPLLNCTRVDTTTLNVDHISEATASHHVVFDEPVTLPAGTIAAGTAPLKFNSGILLTTPEAGVMEFDGTGIYLTPTNHRRFISLASDSIIATVTATTVASTTLWTGITNANELKPYRVYLVKGCGIMNNVNAATIATITINFGATAVCTMTSPGAKFTNADWHFESYITVRTTGNIASGTVSSHGALHISGGDVDMVIESIAVDTTAANDITIKVTWSGANADNWLKLTQCWLATAD